MRAVRVVLARHARVAVLAGQQGKQLAHPIALWRLPIHDPHLTFFPFDTYCIVIEFNY